MPTGGSHAHSYDTIIGIRDVIQARKRRRGYFAVRHVYAEYHNTPMPGEAVTVVDKYDGASLISEHVDTLFSLDDAADALMASAPEQSLLDAIAHNEFLTPSENEAVGFWFARYLTVRYALRELIDDLIGSAGKHLPADDDFDEWCLFITGYCAACQLVRLDRKMLFNVAASSTMQRKFNEAFDEYRIPRKQYTDIFRTFINQRDALAVLNAMRHLNRYRAKLEFLRSDLIVGALVDDLERRETWLDASKRNYFKRIKNYLSHAARRRGVVAMSQTLAHVMEGVGRTASGVGGRSVKRIDDTTRQRACMHWTLLPCARPTSPSGAPGKINN